MSQASLINRASSREPLMYRDIAMIGISICCEKAGIA